MLRILSAIALYNHSGKVSDHVVGDLVPEESASVHLGGTRLLGGVPHLSKRLGQVLASLGGHSTGGVAEEVVVADSVVLGGREGEDLLVGLLLRGLDEAVTELNKHRRRDNAIGGHAGHNTSANGLSPRDAGRLRSDGGHAGRGVDAGILEHVVEKSRRRNSDILRHAGDGGHRAARHDKGANKEKHEQQAALGGALLGVGGEGVGVLLGDSHGRLDLIKVVEEAIIPSTGQIHGIVHVVVGTGEAVGGSVGGDAALQALDMVGQDTHLFPQLTSLDSVGADHLVLLKGEGLDVIDALLLLEHELLHLGLEASQLLFHVSDDDGELLLLIFQALSVLLLALPGVETIQTVSFRCVAPR